MDSTLCLIITLLIIGVVIILRQVSAAKKEAKREAEMMARRAERRAKIMAHQAVWGDEICSLLLEKSIRINMTQEMVYLSWGPPRLKDQTEITKSGTKIRWVYGFPRQNVRYDWFKDNLVVKIKTYNQWG